MYITIAIVYLIAIGDAYPLLWWLIGLWQLMIVKEGNDGYLMGYY